MSTRAIGVGSLDERQQFRVLRLLCEIVGLQRVSLQIEQRRRITDVVDIFVLPPAKHVARALRGDRVILAEGRAVACLSLCDGPQGIAGEVLVVAGQREADGIENRLMAVDE